MRSAHSQRGAAALTVTLILFFVMTMLAAYANRNHVFELRASANQYRATQAFEAAEAGMEWASAMLNSPRPVDATCLPGGSAHRSFRERHLSVVAGTGALSPASWNRDGVTMPLQAACVRKDTGWACSCPAGSEPEPDAPSGEAPAPAFIVRFMPAAQAGLVQLVATGCSSIAGACAPAAGTAADATSRIQVTLGLVPGLATSPVAPLTVKTAVHAGSASLGLHNADAGSGGVAVHAGAAVLAPSVRLTTAPGAPAAAAMVDHDADLGALGSGRLFASFFGMDKTLWKEQPGVARLSCGGECSDAVRRAIDPALGHRMLWIEGELLLEGPTTIGSAERPVVIAASGAIRLRGAVAIHGVIYGASLAWNDTAGGNAVLRGAAISESDYQGNGAPDLVYDTAILAALKHGVGSFARVPGSWKDF